MFPSLAASRIEMSGALAVGGSGGAASATGSTGFVSGAGADCCDSPHPTSTTAAIVVIRRCFITGIANLLIDNNLIFRRFLSHTFGHTFSGSTPKTTKTFVKR
jgi:hypothetical protein